MASCVVSYLDTSGIRHTVELEADGLFEAVVLGVAALREHDCDPGEVCQVVSERLGHASIALTLDVYTHVLPDMQEAAAQKLENILFRSADAL